MRPGVLLSFILFTLCQPIVSAQFFSSGTDPLGIKYDQILTTDFRVVYPRGMDSLAMEYALELQKQRPRVGASIGYLPGEKNRRQWPVILRGFSSIANGMVIDTPRKMELYTVTEPYAPESLYPVKGLAIHELRHVSQNQFCRSGVFGLGHVLLGDIWESVSCAMYPNSDFSEGDAVVAETALTDAGRGQSSDFLEYVRVSLDEGCGRNYYQWRYGSLNRYTPDYYRAGYMMVAGARYVWNEPLFTKKYFDTILRKPRALIFPFGVRNRTFKSISGESFRKCWPQIQDAFEEVWSTDAKRRGPFLDPVPLTASGRYYTSYEGTSWVRGRLLTVRKGIARTPEMVSVGTDGSVRKVTDLPPYFSAPRHTPADRRIFWSEYRPDMRWETCSFSDIIALDPDTGEKTTIMKGGKYFNPVPSDDGSRIAVTEYPVNGGSKILVADSRSGKVLREYVAPERMYAVESVWLGERIIVSAICEKGFGLFEATDGYRTLLPCSSAKIKELGKYCGKIHFTSDHNGVNELYILGGDGAERATSFRSGASSFVFNERGDSLYFSLPSSSAREICSIGTDRLIHEKTDWSSPEGNAIADTLSAQESRSLKQLSAQDEGHVISQTHYSKLAHLVHPHSWVPLYFDYDFISNASLEDLYLSARPGATLFFQNDLNTFSGSVGYAWGNDTFNGSTFRNSGHLKFTYSGLFPVFEVSLDYGDRVAGIYRYRRVVTDGVGKDIVFLDKIDGSNSFSGSVKAYVPLNFSSGGWNRGVIPSVTWSGSNDIYDRSLVTVRYNSSLTDGQILPSFISGENGGYTPMQRLTVSARGYSTLSRARSAVYPRLGAGAEAGCSIRLGLGQFYSSETYEYFYGYLPAPHPMHGIKLTALLQQHLGKNYIFGENYAVTAPRGLSSYASTNSWIARYPRQARLTADYVLPFADVDWAGLSPVAYIRNLELTGHFDYTFLWGSLTCGNGNLFSAGADLVFHLGNLLWLQFDTRIGVSWSYNGGRMFKEMTAAGYEPERHHFGLVFSMDL